MSMIYELREALADRIAERDEAAWGLRCAEALAVTLYVASEPAGGDWKKLGSNDDARKLNTVLILESDQDYSTARHGLHKAERAVRLAEAEVEAYHDQRRREREYAAHRLAEALNPDIVHGNALDADAVADVLG